MLVEVDANRLVRGVIQNLDGEVLSVERRVRNRRQPGRDFRVIERRHTRSLRGVDEDELGTGS